MIKVKALGKVVEVEIIGDIGMWDDEDSVDAREIVSAFQSNSDKQIKLLIDSFGGSVIDGMKIMSAMDRHAGGLSAEIDNIAYSMASAIAAKSPVTSIAANGMMMVHGPWADPYSIGATNAAGLRRTAEELDRYADAISSAYVRGAGPSKETIDSWLKDGENHYFPAQEALSLGLVDSIASSSLAVAACYRSPDRFSPKAATVAVKPEETMSDENIVGGDDPKAVKKESAPDFMAQHKQATASGEKKGKKAEHDRQKAVRAQFYDSSGNFAFGDESDRGDPMVALMQDCIDDMDCSETEALRRITGAFKDGYTPIASLKPVAASPFARDSSVTRFKAGADQTEKTREGMVMATVARMGIAKIDYQNQWRGHSLMDLARDCLALAGHSPYGMSNNELARRVFGAQTTSDFPVIMENILHKSVLAGYESASATYQMFCKEGSVNDLREYKRITPGLISDLEEKDEGGDYRRKPIPDGEGEAVSAKMIGNIIMITPEVLINDDLNYIDSRARGTGMAGKRTIERKVWALLAANPTMADGEALFSAAHANLVNGTNAPVGDPNIDTIDQMGAVLAEQTAPAAKDDPSPTTQYLDLYPYAAVAHRWRKAVLSVLNSSTQNITQAPATSAATGLPFDGLIPDTNPVAGTFSQIATSVMAERVPWYMFADPNVAPVIEVVYLNGQSEPQVVMEEDFNSSGIKWKVEYPHGVGAVGWRGAVKNPGA